MEKENVVYRYNVYVYSAFIKKEILPFVTTRISLGDIMLSKIRQTQKNKYYQYRIPLICGT